MKVIFYRTTPEGSKEIGQVIYDGEKIVTSPSAEWLLDVLFTGEEGTQEEIMRTAPQRFDGDYLRATFEE